MSGGSIFSGGAYAGGGSGGGGEAGETPSDTIVRVSTNTIFTARAGRGGNGGRGGTSSLGIVAGTIRNAISRVGGLGGVATGGTTSTSRGSGGGSGGATADTRQSGDDGLAGFEGERIGEQKFTNNTGVDITLTIVVPASGQGGNGGGGGQNGSRSGGGTYQPNGAAGSNGSNDGSVRIRTALSGGTPPDPTPEPEPTRQDVMAQMAQIFGLSVNGVLGAIPTRSEGTITDSNTPALNSVIIWNSAGRGNISGTYTNGIRLGFPRGTAITEFPSGVKITHGNFSLTSTNKSAVTTRGLGPQVDYEFMSVVLSPSTIELRDNVIIEFIE